MQVFEDLNGEFSARLRELVSTTRQTADGGSTVTFSTARIECDYTPSVIKRLAMGQLVAVPNVQTIGGNAVYSIYEIADVYPMHYSMLTLDKSQPAAIRKEFMELIQGEWEKGSKSTWIEVVAAPTGYTMKESGDSISFQRRPFAPLTGSPIKLLSKESVQKLVCHVPDHGAEDYSFGHLLGVIDENLDFTMDIEKLIHYHVGVFAFTGSGKSNLTSMVIRKAMKVIPDLKVVIFDVSSEYGIHILDVLDEYPSRVVFADPFSEAEDLPAEYLKRHAVPESLFGLEDRIRKKVARLFDDDKVKFVELPLVGQEEVARFGTYEGLVEVLSNTLNDRYGAVQGKILVPEIIKTIQDFRREEKIDAESPFDQRASKLIRKVTPLIEDLPQNSTLKKVFESLGKVIELNPGSGEAGPTEGYSWGTLVDDILSPEKDSPRVFVVNLPEAEDARLQTASVINDVFKSRKRSFTLTPRVLFIIDEAQEFIPYETRKEDGSYQASRTVERLLRHGRKYHLHCWVSTQRIAHLNTNALQQLHSYFVSTMPRPYDRQLISDTFAIDDTFVDRTLAFQNGDWLLTSFKATATQNIPVFIHAENNEERLLEYLKAAD